MDSPNRTFLRLLIWMLAVGGLPMIAALLLVADSGASDAGTFTLRCIMAPVSMFDWLIHSSTFGASLLGVIAILAGIRTVRRERAAAAELRAAARAARLQAVPGTVAAVAATAGVEDALDLVEAQSPFAFVYGWLRPRICVSTGMVDRLAERELEAVFHHERWHLSRRDPARLLLVRTITRGFSLVPAVRRLELQYRLASEIAADRYAVAAMGSRRWLAGALMKLAADEFPSAGVAFLGLVDARVAALAGSSPSETNGRNWLPIMLLMGETALLSILVANGGTALLSALWLHLPC